MNALKKYTLSSTKQMQKKRFYVTNFIILKSETKKGCRKI